MSNAEPGQVEFFTNPAELLGQLPPSSLTVAPAVVRQLVMHAPAVRSSAFQLVRPVGGCQNYRSAIGDIFGEILEDVPSRFANQIL